VNQAGGLGGGLAVAHKVITQPGERRGLLEAHGWRVSRLTLGTLQFGGQRGRQDDQSSIRTVHAALDAGINVIDTADSYGSGHSEEVIGRALGKRRPDVILATKFDLKPDVPPIHEVLRAALMHSLQRLQTDYIDLYQVHNIPLAAMQSPEIFDHLESFRDEGLVRAIGVTAGPGEGHGRECMVAAGDQRVEAIQAAYSLLSPSLAQVVFPYCASRNVAVFAREPLAQGLLTDALDDEATLRMGRRSRWTSEQLDRVVATVRSFDRVRSADESRVGFALRFALSNDHVTSVVCGMRSAEEVASNIRALETGPLQPDVLQEIVELYDDR
jgi:aryl-alcohol dehydrogenase-like predicted oxidoreductase